MNYSIILFIVIALVIFEFFIEITHLFFKILSWILKLAFIAFEYYELYLIWQRNGLFAMILIPFFFVGFLALQIYLMARCKERPHLRKALFSSILVFTPILSLTVTYFIGLLFQIQIHLVLDFLPKWQFSFGNFKII